MKKRILLAAICLVLCLAISLSALSIPGEAAVSVSFVSVNDTLPPELINTYFTYSGVIYIPCWYFNSYDFGIRYAFIDANSTVHLYRNTIQLFFELETGNTYDGNDNYYSLPGIMRNGVPYVPISYVSAFFSTFSYTVTNTEYGRLLRIKDSRVVLSDDEFIQAADSLMHQYYNNYQPVTPSPGPSATPAPTPTPVPTPAPEDKHKDEPLLLSFVGLPGEEFFELLSRRELKACFFLTAEDVLASPATLRRIIYEGHSLGIACADDPAAEISRTAELIFQATHTAVSLVSAPPENEEAAADAAGRLGFAFCPRRSNAVYSPEDDISRDDGTSLFLSCAPGMDSMARTVLDFVVRSGYAVSMPSELAN